MGRLRATLLVAAAAIALSAFPDVIDEAQRWIAHLGNVAAPLTGVVVADYLVVRRRRIDVAALFDRAGEYRFVRGFNVAALLAVAAGVGAYAAVPHTWVKVVWGLGAAALVYVVALPAQAALLARTGDAEPRAEAV